VAFQRTNVAGFYRAHPPGSGVCIYPHYPPPTCENGGGGKKQTGPQTARKPSWARPLVVAGTARGYRRSGNPADTTLMREKKS
jgi:hypothetical protein